MGNITLDLHPFWDDSEMQDKELNRVFNEAIEKKIRMVEIIPGKGSGQLMNKVKRFLREPHIKKVFHRYEVDEKNHGRMFVHFKFK